MNPILFCMMCDPFIVCAMMNPFIGTPEKPRPLGRGSLSNDPLEPKRSPSDAYPDRDSDGCEWAPVATLPEGPEKEAGFRKLLEAKECMVRAQLG